MIGRFKVYIGSRVSARRRTLLSAPPNMPERNAHHKRASEKRSLSGIARSASAGGK